MHAGMKLQEMLQEVVRHSEVKRDFLADTKDHIAMVPMENFENEVALVLHKPGESIPLQRFEITENFHKQVAQRLKIPLTYYFRLLQDHRDLLLKNVNDLFEREPAIRMVRTLDNRARAFLSRQYRRVDNEEILEQTLPVIRNEYDTKILNTYVDENRMRFKCLFVGDDHAIDLGDTATGKSDIIHTGFEMGNSETGKGSFYIRGFTYRSYCLNGCVFGSQETVSYKQVHVGSKLGLTDDLELSQETQEKEDQLIISASRDVLKYLSSPEYVNQVRNKLLELKGRRPVKDAFAAVESVCKELRLTESESKGVLESFIADKDYTQWGMVNAVTEQANKTESYNRASKLEEMGNKIINLPANRWNTIANMERVAA